MIQNEIREALFASQDKAYKEFQKNLIPGYDTDRMIGVRTPQLRALAKQYDAVLPYIQDRCLAPWTHNKAIQKAIESRRIAPKQKEYLRSFKRKV